MMSDVAAILASSGYFLCEREHCTLRRSVCVARQRANLKQIPLTPAPFPGCENCPEGKQIWQTMEEDNSRKPRRGQGERDLHCQYYDTCLSEVAEKDWKSFNCEHCPLFTKAPPAAMKTENTRLCACGRPTIHPNSPYCSRCLAEKSKAARLKKSTPPALKTPAKQPQPPKPSPEPGKVISIDFQGYPEVLESLKKLAHNEVRPLEAEILFAVKIYVEKAQAA